MQCSFSNSPSLSIFAEPLNLKCQNFWSLIAKTWSTLSGEKKKFPPPSLLPCVDHVICQSSQYLKRILVWTVYKWTNKFRQKSHFWVISWLLEALEKKRAGFKIKFRYSRLWTLIGNFNAHAIHSANCLKLQFWFQPIRRKDQEKKEGRKITPPITDDWHFLHISRVLIFSRFNFFFL